MQEEIEMETESILYSRIKELCKNRDITLAQLERDVGLAPSAIRKWKNQSSPSVDKVFSIAKYFNVSSDYLIGLSDMPTPIDDFVGDDTFVSLQRARASLSERDNERLTRLLKIGFDFAFRDEDEES